MQFLEELFPWLGRLMPPDSEGGLLISEVADSPSLTSIYGPLWPLILVAASLLAMFVIEVVVRATRMISTRDATIGATAAGGAGAIATAFISDKKGTDRAKDAGLVGLIIACALLIAYFVMSQRWLMYPLALFVILSFHAHAHESAQLHLDAQNAISSPHGDKALESLQIATTPLAELNGGFIRILARVDNQSDYDLIATTMSCTLYLQSGQEAHREQVIFEAHYPVPSGFGALLVSDAGIERQFEWEKYEDTVSCSLTSALFSKPEVTKQRALVTGNETIEVALTDAEEARILNDESTGVSNLTVRCVAVGFGHGSRSSLYSGWVYLEDFDRPNRRIDEPIVNARNEKLANFVEGRSVLPSGRQASSLKLVRSPSRCDTVYVEYSSDTWFTRFMKGFKEFATNAM